MRKLRCAGCKRKMGVTRAVLTRQKIYCDEWCALQPDAGFLGGRNDMMIYLYLRGMRQIQLARTFKITHSTVQEILKRAGVLPASPAVE